MKLHLLKAIPIFIGCFMLNMNLIGQKIILSIDKGEEILFPESSISLNDTQGGIQVCTVDDSGNYYVYAGGKKLGTFGKKEDAFEKIIFPETIEESDDQSNFENKAFDEKFVIINEKGESFINAGGKSLGPFSIVKELYFSPDGKHFAATAGLLVDKEKFITEYHLLTSESHDIKLKGEPSTIRYSQSLKTVVVCTEEVIRQEVDMKEVEDYTAKVQALMKEFENGEMNADAITKLGEKMEQLKKPDNSQPQNSYYINSNNGISLGPIKSCPSEKNLGFGINSGERWHLFDSGKLYISGNLSKDFGSDISVTNFWWSKNGNGYAFSTYSELVFSDGVTYPYPLEMKFVEENGKSFLKWIILENKRNFILYQKEL
jgi:hypothetical protein